MNPSNPPFSLRVPALLAALATVGVPSAHGLGFRIPNQDPEAIGRGNAFAATADNPAALYYNPAGITQLEGQQIQVGSLLYLGVEVEYTSPSGVSYDNVQEVLPAPHLHYVCSPENSPLSFGLGVYTPFGLAMQWEDPTTFRTLAVESQLMFLTVNPVVAWQVLPSLSLAAGFTANYSQADFSRGIGFVPGDLFRFEGEGWGYGMNAGLLWKPHAKWSFGLNYRSGLAVDYDGDVTTSPSPPYAPPVASSAEIQFPHIVSGGVSFRPTPRWNLEVDVDWTGWETLDTVTIEGVASLAFNWNSSFFYHAGVTRELGRGYSLSAGYFFSEASVPDTDYSPAIPDTDLHVGSLGLAYRGEHWRWALAGQIIAGPSRTVEGSRSPSLVGESADGDYQIFTPSVAVSVGYRF